MYTNLLNTHVGAEEAHYKESEHPRKTLSATARTCSERQTTITMQAPLRLPLGGRRRSRISEVEEVEERLLDSGMLMIWRGRMMISWRG